MEVRSGSTHGWYVVRVRGAHGWYVARVRGTHGWYVVMCMWYGCDISAAVVCADALSQHIYFISYDSYGSLVYVAAMLQKD